MSTIHTYILASLILYFSSYFLYFFLSKGLGHKAQYLQLRRFIPCAILAVLPMYLANQSLFSPYYLSSLFIGLMWIVTYPLFYYLTYHQTSSDFGFHLDTVFGLYIVGWLSSLKLLIAYFNILPLITIPLISLSEWTLSLIICFQWIYYCIYKSCVNDSSIALIRETDQNEAIEFYRSMPIVIQILTPLICLISLVILLYINFQSLISVKTSYLNIVFIIAIAIFLTIYLWNTKKGVFIRTGIIELYLDVKNYIQETSRYTENLHSRLQSLIVTRHSEQETKPSTIILVIGESESRDYMSSFCNYSNQTTPWLDYNCTRKNFLIFKNAYACKDQTIPVIQNALTETNQYHNQKFYEACSVIDIAKKAGYKTYWFSNQGHIGSAETAITLIANTADKAEWTKQNLNQFQYDASLIDNLQQVNPSEKNFIVLHFMGSHFNFINRYPQEFAKFSKPNKYDLIPNYIDSIAYTDHVLQKIHEYASEHLNLQAMIYFSDHATVPDKRRSPNFGGFATVRIPLFTYFSDEYIANHKTVYDALVTNKNKYWTNDLAYELICGILDIQSNHYDETNSLASLKYKYTRDMLLTDLGNLHISDDKDG